MFSRIRIALGLAFLFSLLTSVTALAKGQFSFIAVTGGELIDEVRLGDPALTEDFFTFADFYEDRTKAPDNPGIGYEITRYYVKGYTESAFDKLIYYPETGFVYYDGIVNGSSEYDDKWYTAQPDIKDTFETALFTQIRLMKLGTQEGSQAMVPPAEPIQAVAQARTRPALPQTQAVLSILMVVGLVIIITVAVLQFRKLSPRYRLTQK
jgi:hypothetical protein